MLNTMEERELKVETAVRQYTWRLIYSARKTPALHKVNQKLLKQSIKDLKILGVDNYKELTADHLRLTALHFPDNKGIQDAIAEVLVNFPNNIIKLKPV